jgi:tetratricopeptide (TPR) repeat protein
MQAFPGLGVHFQRGRLWTHYGDLDRGRGRFEAAVQRLPADVPAQGHLAELEAAIGEKDAAIARLRPRALASDDPDYATQLARILAEAREIDEARRWRDKALVRRSSRHQPGAQF